jgi:hypothetical protein
LTIADAINNRGEVAGCYTDSAGYHGYVYDNGTYTTLNVPGATGTLAEAINDRGEVAGDYTDSSGGHGYVYDNGTFTALNVPGANFTSPDAINNRGEVAGLYDDSSGEHGLLATPHGGEATSSGFGERLSAHAHLGGMRDFVPDVPGINAGSPHSAHASGAMDQMFAAGARFTSFGALASDHALTQALSCYQPPDPPAPTGV